GSPGGVSDMAGVTVTGGPVSAVSVAPTAATILMGATTQLQATTTDSLGNVLTGRTVTWASNNSAVTVGGNGLATGAGSGSATITATSEGKSGTARSEEHTSELQSPDHLVFRLLLEKKNRLQPQHLD